MLKIKKLGLAAALIPFLLTFPQSANAAESDMDFMGLPTSGILMLTNGNTYSFVTCSKTRTRMNMYAKATNTWQQVARAFMTLDNTGTCDIDYPYLQRFTWRLNSVPPKSYGTRNLQLGIGTSTSDLLVRRVGVYANQAEASKAFAEMVKPKS